MWGGWGGGGGRGGGVVFGGRGGCVFGWYGGHRDLHVLTHSFPTRRSSDLGRRRDGALFGLSEIRPCRSGLARPRPIRPVGRSEEHTSELQSLMRISYAVFCLKTKHTHHRYPPPTPPTPPPPPPPPPSHTPTPTTPPLPPSPHHTPHP